MSEQSSTTKLPGSSWRIVRTKVVSGRRVEMAYAESGKGRAKVKAWRYYIDGEYAGYASIAPDAEVNWRRTLDQAERI